MEDQKIKEILIEKKEEFKRLYLNHQELEQKLETLLNKSDKNNQDQLELQKIKKQKLKIKDEMQKHIFAFKKQLRKKV